MVLLYDVRDDVYFDICCKIYGEQDEDSWVWHKFHLTEKKLKGRSLCKFDYDFQVILGGLFSWNHHLKAMTQTFFELTKNTKQCVFCDSGRQIPE